MPWFRLDDQTTFQAKVVKAGNAAFGAWVRLGCYSNAHLTDGFIAESIARMVASRRELARLVVAELAHAVDGGIVLHDLDHQPTKDEAMAHRAELSAKRAEAGRVGGKASGISRNRSKQLQLGEKQNEPPTRPDPSRPDPGDSNQGAGEARGPLVSRSKVLELWMSRTGSGPFVQGIELVQERVEAYARDKAGGRGPAEIAAAAIDAFIQIADGFSPGFRPQKTGYKFADHWARIEPVLDGAPIELPAQKAGAGPTIVSGLDFSKKERP